MVKTMHQAQGVGLAANQVGSDWQVFVLECRFNPRYPGAQDIPLGIYLNPRILKSSKDQEMDWEGCLSIPGYRGLVRRAKEVTFEALTPEGKKVKETVKGFHARVIQHEVDHLCGFFYVDRMPDLKQWFHLEEFSRQKEVEIEDR